MYIIVVGCGKVGSRFAKVLSNEGHDVVIIDQNRNSFKSIGDDFRGMTITGVPIDKDVLKQAGIENADAIAAVTPEDNINIMVSQVAKEIFKVPRVLARIYNPSREHIFHHFGLKTICPTNITVDIIRSMLLIEKAVYRHTIGNMVFSFRQCDITDEDMNKKVSDMVFESDSGLFGIVRDKNFLFPTPNMKLLKGDALIITKRVD